MSHNDVNMGEQGEGDFEVGAKRVEKTVGDGNLNPNKKTWKQKLAGTVAGATLLAAAGLGINKTIEANTNTPDFGEPLSDHSLIVDLNNITNEGGENLPPTFREDPKSESKELAPEELKERGIDLSNKNIRIREVRGATYPGNPLTTGESLKEIASNENFDVKNSGFITDMKSGVNFGVWGEIVITDPNTGEDKPTGIFLSKNFYSEPEKAQSTSQSVE